MSDYLLGGTRIVYDLTGDLMSKKVLRTKLCDMLGIEYPIMCAAMAPNVTDPELAAAVGEAGGIGVMACGDKTPDEIREMGREIRKLTDKPFGLDIALAKRAQPLPYDLKEAIAYTSDCCHPNHGKVAT